MKTTMFLALALIVLASCNDDQEIVYHVSPDLSPIINEFYQSAESHGVTIPKNLIADFSNDIQASIQGGRIGDQKTLYIRQGWFNWLSQDQREKWIFLNLGKLFLNKPAEDMVEVLDGYNSENKAAKLDSLFE
jgi:hypothetical protein